MRNFSVSKTNHCLFCEDVLGLKTVPPFTRNLLETSQVLIREFWFCMTRDKMRLHTSRLRDPSKLMVKSSQAPSLLPKLHEYSTIPLVFEQIDPWLNATWLEYVGPNFKHCVWIQNWIRQIWSFSLRGLRLNSKAAYKTSLSLSRYFHMNVIYRDFGYLFC